MLLCAVLGGGEGATLTHVPARWGPRGHGLGPRGHGLGCLLSVSCCALLTEGGGAGRCHLSEGSGVLGVPVAGGILSPDGIQDVWWHQLRTFGGISSGIQWVVGFTSLKAPHP